MSSDNETTQIGKGIRVKGEITGTASIEVWGEVEGTAGTEGLFRVREGGKVSGEVAAKNVIVDGQVNGQLTAEQKIELSSTCKVHGDVSARNVAVADGAYFEGRVKMTNR